MPFLAVLKKALWKDYELLFEDVFFMISGVKKKYFSKNIVAPTLNRNVTSDALKFVPNSVMF